MKSKDILKDLKLRFEAMLNPNLEKVFIVQNQQNVYCEVHFNRACGLDPKLIELYHFMGQKDHSFFDPAQDFNKHISDFMLLDDRSMLFLLSEIFTPEAKEKMNKAEVWGFEDFSPPNQEFDLSPEGLLAHFEELLANQPPSRINPDGTFTARKPEDKFSYIQACDFLEDASKEPEYDKDGYCDYRPVFNKETAGLSLEWYNLITARNSIINSRLYYRYLDEKAIIFREHDQEFLWYEPKEGESIALKYSGLIAYKIRKELIEMYDLEYVYLMLRNPAFAKQFPGALTINHLLSGWIPDIPYPDQVEFAIKTREKQLIILREANQIFKKTNQ